MRERIIVAQGCSETELLRMLARFGVNTVGVRVFGTAELAETALVHSGIAIPGRFIPGREESSLIDSFIRDIEYFKNASYSDSENMASSLRSLRMSVTGDEYAAVHGVFAHGEFEEKNRAIGEIYDRYMERLSSEGLFDTVSLIRRAICSAGPLEAELMVFDEYRLTPLEEKLVDKLSDGQAVRMKFYDMFEKKENADISEEVRAYGISNEVSGIISHIFKNNIPLDSCTVAVTDTNRYVQLFYDLALEHGFDVSFGTGLPIQNSNPARVLGAYSYWRKNGYYGADALMALVKGEAFDRKKLRKLLGDEEIDGRMFDEIINTAGALRLSENKAENKKRIDRYEELNPDSCADVLRILAGELEKSCSEFVSSYSVIREGYPGRVDRSAVKVITDGLDAYFRYAVNGNLDEIIAALLNKTVCSEGSRAGALFVCGIRAAMAGMRKNLFVTGLSSDFYPGSPKENYLLLDSDYALLGEKGLPTSDEVIRLKIKDYDNLLSLASALSVKTVLSYSDYDLAGLKEKNMSSVLADGNFREKAFFEHSLSEDEEIGKAYNDGAQLKRERSADDDGYAGLDKKRFSPTAVDMYFNCPKKFWLTYVMRLEESEEVRPFEVISAKDTGLLLHSAMEHSVTCGENADEVRKYAAKQFDEYVSVHIPLSVVSRESEKKRYVNLAVSAFEMNMGTKEVGSEIRLEAVHDCGITLYGTADRIEETEDGKHCIVDFKTGYRVKHVTNDIDTCSQVLIYAYLAEKNGYEPVLCEYRYPARKKRVLCAYNDEMKEKLAERLTEFKNGIESGSFECTSETDNCRYCAFSDICGRKIEENGEY